MSPLPNPNTGQWDRTFTNGPTPATPTDQAFLQGGYTGDLKSTAPGYWEQLANSGGGSPTTQPPTATGLLSGNTFLLVLAGLAVGYMLFHKGN
jgi:hypothetical protein